MQYKHSEDGEKLCKCPRCGWTGTLHQTEELQQVGEEPIQVCPRCSEDVPVVENDPARVWDDFKK